MHYFLKSHYFFFQFLKIQVYFSHFLSTFPSSNQTQIIRKIKIPYILPLFYSIHIFYPLLFQPPTKRTLNVIQSKLKENLRLKRYICLSIKQRLPLCVSFSASLHSIYVMTHELALMILQAFQVYLQGY